MPTKMLGAIVIALLSSPAWATDYIVNVHGIVCSFCAKGVTKKVSKLPFIDKSKYNKGVKVEIEDQKVTIAVLPDQDLDILPGHYAKHVRIIAATQLIKNNRLRGSVKAFAFQTGLDVNKYAS